MNSWIFFETFIDLMKKFCPNKIKMIKWNIMLCVFIEYIKLNINWIELWNLNIRKIKMIRIMIS